jgi:hypothetical protein
MAAIPKTRKNPAARRRRGCVNSCPGKLPQDITGLGNKGCGQRAAPLVFLALYGPWRGRKGHIYFRHTASALRLTANTLGAPIL